MFKNLFKFTKKKMVVLGLLIGVSTVEIFQPFGVTLRNIPLIESILPYGNNETEAYKKSTINLENQMIIIAETLETYDTDFYERLMVKVRKTVDTYPKDFSKDLSKEGWNEEFVKQHEIVVNLDRALAIFRQSFSELTTEAQKKLEIEHLQIVSTVQKTRRKLLEKELIKEIRKLTEF